MGLVGRRIVDREDAALQIPVGAGEFYWFGGVSQREGDSSGFFRTGGDNRTVPDLYPSGFLPNIITTVEDGSLAVGWRMLLGNDWDMDLSVNHGKSQFGFEERNWSPGGASSVSSRVVSSWR